MEETEVRLKEIIIERYGSLKRFCEKIDMPWTTLDSILKRGVANSNITNVMKITKELGLDTESLALGKIADAIYREKPAYESNDDIREIKNLLIDMKYIVHLEFSTNYGHSLIVKKADHTHSVELKNSDLHNILNQSNQFIKYLLSNCIEEKYCNKDYKEAIPEEAQIKRIFGYPESEDDIKEFISLRTHTQLDAAHLRTDIGDCDTPDTSDNDIMDDENF